MRKITQTHTGNHNDYWTGVQLSWAAQHGPGLMCKSKPKSWPRAAESQPESETATNLVVRQGNSNGQLQPQQQEEEEVVEEKQQQQHPLVKWLRVRPSRPGVLAMAHPQLYCVYVYGDYCYYLIFLHTRSSSFADV